MTSLKTVSMAMLVAFTAICIQADAQIYYPQPVQQQYYPVQPTYQPMPVQQPVQDFQGSVQPFSGTPFDPNDPSTFYGETSETAQEATDQRPWDPSQGHMNDDTVISVEEDDYAGMVIFRYPADAEASLKYTINEAEGTLAPGTNLKIPSGDDFKFSFVPAEGKEAMAYDITKDGNYNFKATDNGWTVVDYMAPQDDPAIKKAMAEKEEAAKKKKAMMEEKAAAEKKEMMEKEAMMKEKEEKAAAEKKAAMEKEAEMKKQDAADKKADEMNDKPPAVEDAAKEAGSATKEAMPAADEDAAAAASRAKRKAKRAAARARENAAPKE